MAPTTDDLRSLLDDRTRVEPGGPSSDLTATARLAGVRARVRHVRARRAGLTAAAAVVLIAGSVSVVSPSPLDGTSPARPVSPVTTAASSLTPTLPAKDVQGRPRALVATLSTTGPRAVTFTVMPRRAGLTFDGDCIGSVDVERLVYVNGHFSHRGDCSAPGTQLDRDRVDWEVWGVAVGRPMTVEIVLGVVSGRLDPPKNLREAPPTTFVEALYGDVEVLSMTPLATASPRPIRPGDLPVLARGTLTQDRRRIDIPTPRDFDAYTLVVHCAGVTSGLQIQVLFGDLGRTGTGCSPERRTIAIDPSTGIPRGTRLTVRLVEDSAIERPVSGPLDPVAIAFELRRGVS